MPIGQWIGVVALALGSLAAIGHGLWGITHRRIRVRFGYVGGRRAVLVGAAFLGYGAILAGAAVALALWV